MNKDYVKAFIYYNSNIEQDSNNVKKTRFSALVLPAFSLLFGILLKGAALILSIIELFIALITVILTTVMIQKASVKDSIFIIAIGQLNFIITLILFSLIVCLNGSKDVMTMIFIVLIPSLTALLSIIISNASVKKGKYLNKKSIKRQNSLYYSALGGAIGISLGRAFFSKTDQLTAMMIVVILSTFLSSVMALLSFNNFLRLYYLKKLDIDKKAELPLKL